MVVRVTVNETREQPAMPAVRNVLVVGAGENGEATARVAALIG